jgi:hypothetical protein
MTFSRAGIFSRFNVYVEPVTFSPSFVRRFCSVQPQRQANTGSCRIVSRGRCSGSGLRSAGRRWLPGWPFVLALASGLAAACAWSSSASPISISSCAISVASFSDDLP